MLYIVHGTDRAKQKKYIDDIKMSSGSILELKYSVIERSDFSVEDFSQRVLGESLFLDREFIVLDGVCEIKDNRDYILSIKDQISKSQNTVVLQEISMDSEFVDSMRAIAMDIVEYKKTGQSPDFTLWSGIYKRDKKVVWVAYIKEVNSSATEKIHAGILSQVKNMYKIKNASLETSFKSLGFLKEGSYQSAARGAKLYDQAELLDMLYELSLMFGQAHAGEVDFKLTLERFILKYI